MLVRIRSRVNSFIPLMGMYTGAIALENYLAVFTKTNPMPALWPSIPTPKYICKRNECKAPPKDVLKNIHTNFIHGASKLETTQTPNKRMDK